MNLIKLEERFPAEVLNTIKSEIEAYLSAIFTEDDRYAYGSVIDTMFVQPIFYSLLLNYITISEQRSSLSLRDIYLDESIPQTKRDIFFKKIANDAGINTQGLTTEEIVSSVENRLSVSESEILATSMNLVKQYEKAFDATTGTYWYMFRNSPSMVRYANNSFAAPYVADNLKSDIPILDIEQQAITLSDINDINFAINDGRLPNYIDIYVKPKTKVITYNIVIPNDGSEVELTTDSAKWAWFDFVYGSGDIDFYCKSMSDGYLGFGSRSVTFGCKGTPNSGVTINAYYYEDDQQVESDLKSNNSQYNIEFFGPPRLEISIKTINKNKHSELTRELSRQMTGIEYVSKFASISSSLSKSGNAIVSIKGKLYINPIVYKEVELFGTSLSVRRSSIASWVDIKDAAIRLVELSDMETGDVVSV